MSTTCQQNRPLLSSHDNKITKTHATQFAFISTAHIKLILPMTAKFRYICQNKNGSQLVLGPLEAPYTWG